MDQGTRRRTIDVVLAALLAAGLLWGCGGGASSGDAGAEASTRDAASGDVGARVDAASDSGARVD
ncbi:MAG: hypothetical protein GXP55_04400, partial [Deltaproteobacteria bacterium]|nr:hypothetical protein [Deltaproteobacteria bacterium]